MNNFIFICLLVGATNSSQFISKPCMGMSSLQIVPEGLACMRVCVPVLEYWRLVWSPDHYLSLVFCLQSSNDFKMPCFLIKDVNLPH